MLTSACGKISFIFSLYCALIKRPKYFYYWQGFSESSLNPQSSFFHGSWSPVVPHQKSLHQLHTTGRNTRSWSCCIVIHRNIQLSIEGSFGSPAHLNETMRFEWKPCSMQRRPKTKFSPWASSRPPAVPNRNKISSCTRAHLFLPCH